MDDTTIAEDDDGDMESDLQSNEHSAWGQYDNYGGQGFPAQPWEQRHHHPTRLSDVVEEDTQTERSG